MNIKNINKHINTLHKYLDARRLNDAFEKLNKLIRKNPELLQLEEHVEKQINIYRFMLKYSFSDVKDPDRDKIYARLLQSVYEITDHAKYILSNAHTNPSLNEIRKGSNSRFGMDREFMEKVFFEITHDEDLRHIFNRYWLSHDLKQQDIEFVRKVVSNENLAWANEAILVSALTVGLMFNFNPLKLRLLFDFYYKGGNNVWQRALVGIVFGIHKYANRISQYPDLSNEIKLLSKDEDFMLNLQYVMIQLVKTKDTEKISKKLNDEILPEVAKYKSKIEDRLKLDNIIDSMGDDKNPDWEKVFGDSSSELLNKLEELSKMQIEGSDIFMGTFSLMKNFDFFNHANNWFMPFFKDNIDIFRKYFYGLKGLDTDAFMESFENAAFLCNSDKYSFLFGLLNMPENKRESVMSLFQVELESMNEVVKDEKILNKKALDKYKINQYIQDIYRFYKLYKHKDEFEDIFDWKLEIYQSKIIQNEWFNQEIFKSIASLYFKSEYYEDAINIYKILIEKGFNERIAFEQIAYSYQKLRDFENALVYYKKSELFGGNLKWVTKKIALCHRELNENNKAIEYYKQAEAKEPENLYIQANLGNCYIRIKDYENALKHYFKVEYFAPDNKLIQRPIAWCSFVLGKFDTAINYYNKLLKIESEVNWKDYINYGHTLWCNNELQNAVDAYRKSIELTTENSKVIRTTFLEDKKFLIKHGIDKQEIELMLDYIFMKD